MFSLNSWTDRKNRLCSFCQHLQNFFLSTRQNLSWKSWIFVKLRQNMCKMRCVCSDPSSHHVLWWLSLCDVGGSALFFVSSFPVKNVKGLLINTFIYTPMAEAGLQEASPHNSKCCRPQKFDLALALWLVAAGGWSSETINHRNAARWCWMDPSQPSLTASPGQAGKHSSKTFPLLPQCTAMGTRRALADTICH